MACTAFGSPVDIPSEFVAPISTASASTTTDPKSAKHKPKKKATAAPSSVYSKRPTGPTAASAGRSSAAGSSSHNKEVSANGTFSTMMKGVNNSTAPNARDRSPVDFEYDLEVRRRLREEIDSERAKMLHDAAEKEAQLRAANKWVCEKGAAGDRKQAWNCVDQQQQRERLETAREMESARSAGTKAPVRASSAASSRSKSPSTHTSRSSTSKRWPVKSSIAPNVSEWRTQAFSVHSSADAAAAEWRRAEQQQRRQQQREAKDVHDTIDDFELRMRQLATSI